MTDKKPLVVVMGVAGSGKTTVGEELAQRLGVPFRDGDSFHSQANVAKMHAGHPLDDDDRRPWLLSISSWLRASRDSGAVVACSALKRSYRDLLRAEAPELFIVHLSGPREEAARRVASRTGHYMPASLVDSQYRTLEPLGDDEGGLTVDFTGGVGPILDEVLAALR